MKCIYAKTCEPPRCNKLADYVYLGKSYCKKHVELRSIKREGKVRLG
jgi:hypothetical protein